MKNLGSVGRFLLGALILLMLVPNTFTLIGVGIAVFTTTSTNPSGRLGYFTGALVMEVIFILILKRFVVRRTTKVVA